MVKTQKEVPEKANVKMEIEIGEKISREGRSFCSGKALIPFAVFIVLYLGSGIFLQLQGVPSAFYQFPAPLAAVPGIIAAFFILPGHFEEKFETFVKGCGDSNIIIMCLIFLLAGGFASVCKAMGGIDAAVNLGLTYIPTAYLGVGIFIISSFIATATGTSVGSAAAVGPIAIAVAERTGMSLPLIMGCVIGGIMLGDNLSIISDTTIASTRTQGCAMKDKFRLNFWLTLVPALITVFLLIMHSGAMPTVAIGNHDFSLLRVLPYIVVLVTAIWGMNVFLVLVMGTVLAGCIGLYYGELTVLSWTQAMYTGFKGMCDIFFLSLLSGGLAAMVSKAGGITWLLLQVQRGIRGKKTAELGISALVSLSDIALANNTVAIIINGEIAKSICYRFHVDPRRSAALLSTFSTIFQGLIPYGAQMLMVTGFAGGKVSPLAVLPYTWFIYLLALSALVSIFIPFSDGFIRKNPWDFTLRKPVNRG